jgi:acetolactate decarboxylase
MNGGSGIGDNYRPVSELEFLGALHVELLRHRDVHFARHQHDVFQTSTVEALLGGAYEGDVTIGEVLEHGDLGLGTLNGLDGELIVIDGEAWKAELDCTLVSVPASARTPYAVVVPFAPAESVEVRGALDLLPQFGDLRSPIAIRIDGRFTDLRIRSVPRQRRPFPPLADAIAHQHITELTDVSGTMVGFCFPDALDGIEIVGWHLHFATEDRTRGGHVLGYTLLEATARVDDVTDLHVELPPAIDIHHQAVLDQEMIHRLETEG